MIASDLIIINCGEYLIVDGERYLAPTAYNLSFSKPIIPTLYKHIEYRPLPSMSDNKSFTMSATDTSKAYKSGIDKYTPGQFRGL